ncbi:MAG TPA: 3-deoxy-7-phosphoheptulonate synthase [Polyangiaceae bacterium]|nr:3-deoxy-7-phosphoheptulonate synthase [Polyangiaceae bacterium]
MRPTNDLNVIDTAPLLTPDQLKAEVPISTAASELVFRTREEIRGVLRGRDPRMLVIVGPCSIHDPSAAIDYAERLRTLRARHESELLVVMRVYFEKPRTTVGWKGLINDPHLNGSCDIATGLRLARELMAKLADMGLPAATEVLDPIVPQYLADLIAWAAIGARTTESQTHREMASGLSMPVGYKNGTDGSLMTAIQAQMAASRPHSFLGIDASGRVAVVRTAGNRDGHVVLRGGNAGPNYSQEHVAAAAAALEKAGVHTRLLVDCSHDNSGKSHLKQPDVIDEVSRQVAGGAPHLLGVMIESNIVGGKQKFDETQPATPLVYGQSITDACIDWPTTERMLAQLAHAQRTGRRAALPAYA